MKTLLKAILITVSVLHPGAPCPNALAQWSSDPQHPLVLEHPNYHGDPELLLSDGRYIFSSAVVNPYKRKLKALDFYGQTIWSNNDAMPTSDQISTGNDIKWPNFITDREGNSLLVQITRKNYSNHYYLLASKISRSGQNTWTTGTQLSKPGFNAIEHRMAVDHQNNLFLAVIYEETGSTNKAVSMVKIDPQGTIAWELPQYIYTDSSLYLDHDICLIPDHTGGCFAAYILTNYLKEESGGRFIDSDFLVNHILSNGLIAWEKDLVIYHSSGKFFYPKAIAATDGILYFMWENYFLQKVDPEGFLHWPEGGVRISYDYKPSKNGLFEIGTDGNLRVFSSRVNYDGISVTGQVITPEGDLLWGRNGRSILTMDYAMWAGVFAFASYNDTTLILYDDALPNQPDSLATRVLLIDRWGFPVWPEPIELSRQPAGTSGPVSIAPGYEGQFVIGRNCWQGQKYTYWGQNIHLDGTFGNRSTFILNRDVAPALFKGYDPLHQTLFFEPIGADHLYQLLDLTGKVVIQGIPDNITYLPDVPAGWYVLTLTEHGKRVESHKLIVN